MRSASGAGRFAFASADGSQVFFVSEDFLTKAAEEAGEAGPKEYDYDVETGGLSYLPEVHGAVASVASNGASLMFVNTTASPETLELWQRASGKATVVGELPPITNDTNGGSELAYLDRAFVSGDGGVYVFLTKAQIPGFNDGGISCSGTQCNQFDEVFRYDVSEGKLACLSCGPVGVTPRGDASMGATSILEEHSKEWEHDNGEDGTPETTVEARGMSADGERVFFDTPNPLRRRRRTAGATCTSGRKGTCI